MNCREASIQISLHVGDDLPAAEVPALEEHLEHCAVCQVEYESYASARDALQMLKGESMGTTNLWGDLEAQLDVASPGLRNGSSWFGRPLWAGLAAAAVLAVSAQLWLPFGSVAESATDAVTSSLNNPLSVQKVHVNVGEFPVDGVVDEAGPQSEPATFDDLREFMRGPGQEQTPIEDLDNPMIAAPASRRSF